MDELIFAAIIFFGVWFVMAKAQKGIRERQHQEKVEVELMKIRKRIEGKAKCRPFRSQNAG